MLRTTKLSIPVREPSQKLNRLSLLLCLPSAFHKDSVSTSGLGALALCRKTVAQMTKDTSAWHTSESGRLTPSFTGNLAANHFPAKLLPSMVNFPKLGGHREGP